MRKYGLYEFRHDFPDNKAALAYVMKRRYTGRSKLYKTKVGYSFVTARGRHYNPLWGTIFFDSHVPLDKWFYGLFLVYNTPKWSTNMFCREVGISYRIGWKYLRLFRARIDRRKTFKQNLNEIIDDTSIPHRRKARRVVR